MTPTNAYTALAVFAMIQVLPLKSYTSIRILQPTNTSPISSSLTTATTTTTTPTTSTILTASPPTPTTFPSLLHISLVLNLLDRITILERFGGRGDVVDFSHPGFDVGGLRIVVVGLFYWIEYASGCYIRF